VKIVGEMGAGISTESAQELQKWEGTIRAFAGCRAKVSWQGMGIGAVGKILTFHYVNIATPTLRKVREGLHPLSGWIGESKGMGHPVPGFYRAGSMFRRPTDGLAVEGSSNVFYEVGSARGLGKDLIMTARKETRLPFDVGYVPTISGKSRGP
jgi:hypothetical protein